MQRNQTGPLLHTIYTNSLKTDQKPNVKAKPINVLEENKGVNLQNPNLGFDGVQSFFLRYDIKSTKENKDKLDPTAMKNVHQRTLSKK